MGERLFKSQDAHKLEDPERLVWLPVADVIRALGIRPGMHVADVGVGTGYFAIPMAQAVAPNGKVYAIDLQLEMLNMLRGKLERPDAPPNIELVRGQASKTMLASKCADVVLIANVWHELDDHEAALQEAARLHASWYQVELWRCSTGVRIRTLLRGRPQTIACRRVMSCSF
jgi:SAM-dependent methyltransferase